jgi:hypothetical protein
MFPEIGTGLAPAASAVLTAALTEGPLSRVSLVRRLGLSTAVTKAARPLILTIGDAVALGEALPPPRSPGGVTLRTPLRTTAPPGKYRRGGHARYRRPPATGRAYPIRHLGRP